MIPGWLISLVTFPGVIVHEMGHLFFCRRYGLAVHRVCYFRLGNPAGYVIHEPADTYGRGFWVSVGPLVVSSLMAAAVGFPVGTAFLQHHKMQVVHWALGWLALSIGMHSFPSTGDAKNLWSASIGAVMKGNIIALIGFPVVILIYLANLLSIIWFDAFYAAALILAVPWLIIHYLA